jgi:hypothetical protein
MSDELDDFGLPGRSLDDFLSEEFESREKESTDETPPSTDVEQSNLPTVQDFDPDLERELTLYGAMRLAAEAAVDALRGRMLSDQANAFRSYLISFRNELRS